MACWSRSSLVVMFAQAFSPLPLRCEQPWVRRHQAPPPHPSAELVGPSGMEQMVSKPRPWGWFSGPGDFQAQQPSDLD